MGRDAQALQPPDPLAQHHVPPTISKCPLWICWEFLVGSTYTLLCLCPAWVPLVLPRAPEPHPTGTRGVLVLLAGSLQPHPPGTSLPGPELLLTSEWLTKCSLEKLGGSHCSFPKVLVWLMCHQCHRTTAQPLLLLLHSLNLTIVREPMPPCPAN